MENDYDYDPNEQESVDVDVLAIAEREKQDRIEVVANIMRTPAGRKWVYELLGMCGVRTVSAVPNDPYSTYFNSGQQAIGHYIEAQVMEAASDMYLVMCSEANLPVK